MDLVQQLGVVLLGYLASRLVDILAERLQPSSLPMRPNVQPPQVYKLSPPAPASQKIPMVGVTVPNSEKVSSDGTDKGVATAPDSPKAPQDGSKCHCITPTPASIPDFL